MAFDLPRHLVELADHVRKQGVAETRRLNFDHAKQAVYDLCRGVTTPDVRQRAMLTSEALADLAQAFGQGEISPTSNKPPDAPASPEELRSNPTKPLSDDLSALQVPCPRCSAWELVSQGSRYPLVTHCRACGETSELK